MATKLPKTVEFECSYCGRTYIKSITTGRPDPGKCPRKTGDKPHSWIINGKF